MHKKDMMPSIGKKEKFESMVLDTGIAETGW
jgi:hypothetical protein